MRISRLLKLLKITLIVFTAMLAIYCLMVATRSWTKRQPGSGLHPVDINVNKRTEVQTNSVLNSFSNNTRENSFKIQETVLVGDKKNDRVEPFSIQRKLDKEHREENILKPPSEKILGNNLGEERLNQSNLNWPQLEKLSEIGGFLVKKKTPEFFHNISFPPFVDSRDPHGLGEGGRPVDLQPDSETDRALFDEGWKKNGFNQYISDKISVHRTLPDARSEECKRQALGYSTDLPDVSVVIIFHNEAWSTLLRSVHSILDRTPEHLLREIVLVDDLSTMDHLKAPLEKYFNAFPKVKIIRCDKRQGLTRARLLGFYASTAPIVVFLDSHIECFPHCLQPLLQRIHEHPTSVVFPAIETIHDKTLALTTITHRGYGIFSWKELTFDWAYAKAKPDDAIPVRSPTMPGGLFAINRGFFEKLGTYDPGLEYWGGENIELSFKAWMCGGTVEMITCSHIGHIFRGLNPIKWTRSIGLRNAFRVAEVWMDDFKNYFYERFNYRMDDYGDVTERKALRQKLGCHSFQWYLQNVYPDVPLLTNVIYSGEIQTAVGTQCLDSMGTDKPMLYPCHGLGVRQFWHFTQDGHIDQDYKKRICIHDNGDHLYPHLQRKCKDGEKWDYDVETKWLKHSPSDLCLTSSVTYNSLTLQKCSDSRWQQWTMTKRRTDLNFPTL